jgi:outer membrane biosynthesis protein TonB
MRVFVAKALTLALVITSTAFSQQPNPPKSSAPPFSLGVQLLTDPQGVDMNSYIRDVYKAVKDKAAATMPASVLHGDQGAVSIRLQIQKDGTLPSPALPRFVFSSGKRILDEHAMGSILKAAPFEHLPEQLSSVELRLTFYYNSSARN